jgi:hypothetical protein
MADELLWRMKGTSSHVVARVRSIRAGAGPLVEQWVRFELRVERSGQLYLTEQFKDRAALMTRSAELRGLLVADGWTAIDG